MPSELVINATLPEIRVALIEDGEIADLSVEYEKNKSIVGNVYKGRIVRVLPGMQAAFVDIGLERAAYLYVADVIYEPEEEIDEEDEAEIPSTPTQNEEAASEESSDETPMQFDGANTTEDQNIDETTPTEESAESEEDRHRSSMSAPPRRPNYRKKNIRRNPRNAPQIQDLVKEGQDILVQVAKEPMGTKGARLTCHISIPGRHVVLMPTIDQVGVSRKIESADERKRLRGIVDALRPPGMGIIVRTVAGNQSNEQLTNEINYLLNVWSSIKKKAESNKAPAVLYEDLNIVLKTVRDNFTDDIYRLVVDSPRVHAYILEFVEQFAPRLVNRIVRYTGKDSIFDAYGIESEISRALHRKVWLKSGGYLIVEQTEALTVIDVNTGKFTGKKNLQDTILKTNLEAVKEVAYQLRMRNAGGIIIIDLIDMERSSYKEKVYRALEDALKRDKAKTNILRISELGLIQMTRKRTRESLNHILCEPCPYCNGNGFTKSLRTVCYDVFRELERTALEGGHVGATVIAHPEVVDTLFQEERDTLDRMEERFGLKVSIKGDPSLHLADFQVQGEKLSMHSSRPTSAPVQ